MYVCCKLLSVVWFIPTVISGAPHLSFEKPVIVGEDYYVTGFQGFDDGLHALGKTPVGWQGTSDGGKSWQNLFENDLDIGDALQANALRCVPFPTGGHGSDEQKCLHGNDLHDGYNYVFNAHRGAADAECGESAQCWCCRCFSNETCTVPAPPPPPSPVPPPLPTAGDVAASVLVPGVTSVSNAIHNLGAITYVPSVTKHYTTFNSTFSTTFAISANGTFVYQVLPQKEVVFSGIPAPGATCGTDHAMFGCPFRTGGRGYVRLSDGTYVMSIIVYLDGADANPNASLAPYATSVIAFRSTDNGYHWTYAGKILTAAQAPVSQEGPNENDMVLLADNKTIMCIIRLDAGDGRVSHPYLPYVKSLSTDGGFTWTAATSLPAGVGCARPRLMRTAAGSIVLSGGRLGPTNRDVRVWLNADGMGETWETYSITYWHNALVGNASLLFTPAVNNSASRESTSYTSIMPMGPNRGLLTYGRHLPPGPDIAFSMVFSIDKF